MLDPLQIAIKAALKAGERIMDIYSSEFAVELKSDQSPLTKADLASDIIIHELLKETGICIVSEESNIPSASKRKREEVIWLVDPLDGTKEFVCRNGEFTVNIALIKNGTPILGVIYCPVLDLLYYADQSDGAFRIDNASLSTLDKSIKLPDKVTSYKIAASRSHLDTRTSMFIEETRLTHPEAELISKGSSLKFCLLAEGSANIYPRFGTTMEWDTAAGHAILKFAGGSVKTLAGKELQYNKDDLKNPDFIARSA